jgi:hypothetical protein
MVILWDGSYGMMIDKSLGFIPVHVDHTAQGALVCGAAFLNFVCDQQTELVVLPSNWNLTVLDQQKSLASKYVLLLPEFVKDGDPFTGRHHFITSNWEEMNSAGNIVRYRVSKATY